MGGRGAQYAAWPARRKCALPPEWRMTMRSIMAMLRPRSSDAATLYDSLVTEARRPGWYVEGQVADSLDGRFRVLATLVALAILRLEQGSEEAVRHSVALTEAFIADIDVQMRETGFSDTSLGKQVRHMVGALATRVDWWRGATAPDGDWPEAVRLSLYPRQGAGEGAVMYSSEALRRLFEGLGGASDAALIAGRLA